MNELCLFLQNKVYPHSGIVILLVQYRVFKNGDKVGKKDLEGKFNFLGWSIHKVFAVVLLTNCESLLKQCTPGLFFSQSVKCHSLATDMIYSPSRQSQGQGQQSTSPLVVDTEQSKYSRLLHSFHTCPATCVYLFLNITVKKKKEKRGENNRSPLKKTDTGSILSHTSGNEERDVYRQLSSTTTGYLMLS